MTHCKYHHVLLLLNLNPVLIHVMIIWGLLGKLEQIMLDHISAAVFLRGTHGLFVPT